MTSKSRHKSDFRVLRGLKRTVTVCGHRFITGVITPERGGVVRCVTCNTIVKGVNFILTSGNKEPLALKTKDRRYNIMNGKFVDPDAHAKLHAPGDEKAPCPPEITMYYPSPELVTKVFNEWKKRYKKDPESFNGMSGDDYGERCSHYFFSLAAEIDSQ